ncbi:hypothetical protein MGU_01808 [Metarhizium guizhouense ARSEF 977]|uniref:Uncharacterized protein n=1 Tax=Metarhizium guizhouense (strain ARSEF 977) TaxID=1276136 RepID=A0A0B4H8X4_METGA|nr:hypothetical protein MGU_01808 [Metarhizium guizhouense ARSEF 977]
MRSTVCHGVDLTIAAASPSGEQQKDDASATSSNSSPERQSRSAQSPASVSTDHKSTHSRCSRSTSNRENNQSCSRMLFSSRSRAIFHPRSLEEIYAEQAYLSLTLHAHIAQHCDLMNRYSLTEAETFQGESRKCKRRARKELGLLRGQLIHAAEQEQIIFARLGELFVEAKSRESRNVAQNQRLQGLRGLRRYSHPQNHEEMRRSMSSLNGATPAFIPQKDLFSHQEYDEDAASTADTGKDDREVSENSLGELLEPNGEQFKEQRLLLRRMSGDDYTSLLKKDRRLSLPTSLGLT